MSDTEDESAAIFQRDTDAEMIIHSSLNDIKQELISYSLYNNRRAMIMLGAVLMIESINLNEYLKNPAAINRMIQEERIKNPNADLNSNLELINKVLAALPMYVFLIRLNSSNSYPRLVLVQPDVYLNKTQMDFIQ